MKPIFTTIILLLMAWLSGSHWAAAQTTNPCDSAGYVLSLAINNVSCPGAATGVASIASTGCVCMFSGCIFTWSNGQIGHTASGLQAGEYSVTVAHPNGCIMDTSVTITEPAYFVQGITKQDPSCSDSNDGVVAVMPAPDSGPLTYHWSTGDTLSSRIGGLSAGKYYVTTTNFINCSLVDSVELTAPTAVSVAATTNPSCSNNASGDINMSVEGGTPPYSCAWSNGETTESLHDIAAGQYQALVTDANGCIANINATVAALPAPQPSITAFTTTICEGSSTQLIATVAGGGTFAWSPSTGLSNPNANAPIAAPTQTTTYTVTTTAANGCIGTAQVTITVEVCIDVESVEAGGRWQIFPNPATDQLWLSGQLPHSDDLQISLYNAVGQIVYRQTYLQQNGDLSLSVPLANLPEGAYIIAAQTSSMLIHRKIVKQ